MTHGHEPSLLTSMEGLLALRNKIAAGQQQYQARYKIFSASTKKHLKTSPPALLRNRSPHWCRRPRPSSDMESLSNSDLLHLFSFCYKYNIKHVTKYSPQAQKNISKHHLRLYSKIARHTDDAAPDRVQIWNPRRILIYYTYFHFVPTIISSTLQNILRKHKKTSRNITSGFTPKSLATRMTPPQTEFRYGILVEFWSSTTIYIILQLVQPTRSSGRQTSTSLTSRYYFYFCGWRWWIEERDRFNNLKLAP